MRIPAFVPALLIAAAGLVAPSASAQSPDRLTLDQELLRSAASLLSDAPEAQAGAVLPFMDLLATQNRSGGGGGGGVLRGVGVGLQVGTPTALTFKFGAGGGANIVLGVGLGFGYDRFGAFGLSLHGDYLFTLATLVNNGTIRLDAYLGPGLWLTLFDRGYGYFGYVPYAFGVEYLGLGVRVPLGLSMRFHTAPIEIYLELDPALFVFPGVGGFIGASLGFRWFF